MLTDPQRDALTEIINAGVSRAGSVLSELVGSTVELHTPSVGLTTATDLASKLVLADTDELASVRQRFTGTLEGRAVLLFPRQIGNSLARQFIGNDSDITSIDSEREEALTEVGNILLNSILGSMSNALEQKFEYEIPVYREGHLRALLTSNRVTTAANDEAGHILYANAHFDNEDFRITGNVLIVFDVAAFNQLLTQVDRMLLQEKEL